MDKLLGFLPDADPTTPGVLTAVTNLIPTEKGMRGAPTGVTPSGVPALAAACTGAAVVTKLDDTRRIFAGTQTKLYELVSGSWNDVGRVAAYTGGADSRWSFAQFGNNTLAANLTDVIQRSTGAGFSDIGVTVKAKIIFPIGAFVMAMNIVEGGATKQNGWICSGSFDDSIWTPSVATLCTTGQLVATPGQITAGGRLGEYAIAYKERSIYIGQFVGAPVVWDWLPVPSSDVGCVGQDAWCDLGSAHFFISADGPYLFDGTRPQPLGVGEVRQWWAENSAPTYRYKTQCVFDKQNNVVWTFFVGLGATTLNSAIVYNVVSKRWGLATVNVESVMNYASAGTTIDGMDAISATIDGLSSYSFDSQFWLSGGRSLAAFNTSHQLQSLTGASASSSMTTGDAGDDDVYSLLTTIRLRFEPGYKPATATVQTFTKTELGGALVAGSSSTMYDAQFDVMDDSRWHRATFNFTGDHRVMALGAALLPEGNV